MKQDNQAIVLMHLSQLATFALAFGSILIPLIIWFTQKDKIKDLDAHGKMILNFQFSLLIYSFICIPLVFVGVGIYRPNCNFSDVDCVSYQKRN